MKFVTIAFVYIFACTAFAATCNEGSSVCWGTGVKRGSSSPSGQPTTGSKVAVNPSAVPVEKGFGFESIIFEGVPDFLIVRGNGRVGAGVSLSNGEETFFGPPGFELTSEYLSRHIGKKKYQSQKLNLATTLAAINNQKSGMGRLQVNFGVAGKVNKTSRAVLPGAGVSIVAGFLMLGYSGSQDEYVVDFSPLGASGSLKYQYSIETLSVGIYLTNLIIDYSSLKVFAYGTGDFSYRLLTGTWLYRDWMVSVASRVEDSNRPIYLSSQKALAFQKIKQTYFGGIQYNISKNFMISTFYNYYLMDDVSLGLTIFL